MNPVWWAVIILNFQTGCKNSFKRHDFPRSCHSKCHKICNTILTGFGIFPMHYRIQHFKEGNNYSAAARHLTLYIWHYICFVYWEIPVGVFSFTYSYAVDKVLAVTNAAVTHCIVPGEDKKFLFEEHTLLKQSNVSLSVIWNSCTCHLMVGFLPPRAHAALGATAVISVETANEGQQSAYAWLNPLTKLSLDLVNMCSLYAMRL